MASPCDEGQEVLKGKTSLVVWIRTIINPIINAPSQDSELLFCTLRFLPRTKVRTSSHCRAVVSSSSLRCWSGWLKQTVNSCLNSSSVWGFCCVFVISGRNSLQWFCTVSHKPPQLFRPSWNWLIMLATLQQIKTDLNEQELSFIVVFYFWNICF